MASPNHTLPSGSRSTLPDFTRFDQPTVPSSSSPRRASSSSLQSPLTQPRRGGVPHTQRDEEEKLESRHLEAGTLGSPIPPLSTAQLRPLADPEKQAPERCSEPRTPWRRSSGWTGWARESIPTQKMVPALVVQAFSAGVLDATTYADFNTFASNQTGNTILLTVSIIGTTPVLLLLTGISLASFLVGAFVFGHIGTYMGVCRRSWLLLTTTYQLLTLLISCILLSPIAPPHVHIGGAHQWVVLVLFAHMSGAQVVAARQSSCQEVPTAPMTSSYVDLVADPHLFVRWGHPNAGPRNRRLAYVLAMVTGALLGAVMHRFAGSWVVVLVTMGLKGVVMGIFSYASGDGG